MLVGRHTSYMGTSGVRRQRRELGLEPGKLRRRELHQLPQLCPCLCRHWLKAEGASGAAAGVALLASGWVSSSAGAPVATGAGASGTGLGAGAGAALGAAAAELREKFSNMLVPRTAFAPPPFFSLTMLRFGGKW